MYRFIGLTALVTALAATTGCVSQQQMLAQKQQMAMATAASRGQFDLNCPSAEPILLSQEVTQPALQGPWVAGIEREEYTIGVQGCGNRKTYVVICPQGGENCFAANSGGIAGDLQQR